MGLMIFLYANQKSQRNESLTRSSNSFFLYPSGNLAHNFEVFITKGREAHRTSMHHIRRVAGPSRWTY